MQVAKPDWKPSVSAWSRSPPAARTSVVRETATVETIAVPTAAPIWNVVLLRPEARPASRSSTPELLDRFVELFPLPRAGV
jgi:hypothetical protein